MGIADLTGCRNSDGGFRLPLPEAGCSLAKYWTENHGDDTFAQTPGRLRRPEGTFSAGLSYEEGDGVKASNPGARYWLGKAAEQGYRKVKARLKGFGYMKTVIAMPLIP